MLVIAAPGQGAQAPGFLAPWLELPGFADRMAGWSELAGCDLIRYGTTAGADEITDTAIAQPLLVAAAIAAAEALAREAQRGDPRSGETVRGDAGGAEGDLFQLRRQAGIAAGHSVGELAAGAIAGVVTPEDAMRLVGVRGRAMAKAAAAEPTGMTAVLGGSEGDVLAALEAHGLTPANVNAAGQIVAAGTTGQLAALAASPPAGTRLRPLSVAGAFHTAHMAPAVAALREAAAEVTVADPAIVLLSNADGAAVTSGRDWLERIVTQVSAPVRWDQCMATMAGLRASALIELPPGGTLTGLARRAMPGLAVAALKGPDGLAAARALLAEHGTIEPPQPGHVPEWRLLVSPVAGIFRAAAGLPPPEGAGVTSRAAGAERGGGTSRAAPGSHVRPGTVLGHVEVRGGQEPVAPAFAAAILEWLVEDGDPVTTGQPLVRLQPGTA